MIATIIVLSNLAGVAVSFFYLIARGAIRQPAIAAFGDNLAVNILTCLAFIIDRHAISYRGITTTEEYRVRARGGSDGRARPVRHHGLRQRQSGEPLRPRSLLSGRGSTPSPLAPSPRSPRASRSRSSSTGVGTSASRPTRRSTEAEKMPGRAALLTVLTILSTYLLVAISSQMFAGHRQAGRRAGQSGRPPTTCSRCSRGRCWVGLPSCYSSRCL